MTKTAPLTKCCSDDVASKLLTPPSPLWLSYVKLTRIHKFPLGFILMFWPCTWGITLSAIAVGLNLKLLALNTFLYLVGATLRYGAGCIWNDICDIKFDRQVERSKGRPLAAGLVSVAGAVSLYIAHVLLCLGLLSFVNWEAFFVGVFGLFLLDPLYPLMKRWTYWPQAWLGIAMTWGTPVSWIAITGNMEWNAVPALLFGGVCWTIHHDTIYACQDRRDDVNAGVKSTAVLFGDAVRPILACFAMLFVVSLAYAGRAAHLGPMYFIISVTGAAVHLAWQLWTIDFASSEDCGRIYRANEHLGLLIWVGILMEYVPVIVRA